MRFSRPSEPYDAQRRDMVRLQLAGRAIRDLRVLTAMGTVAREQFVPPDCRHEAYSDAPLPIGQGQTISQPYMVALMTEALELTPQSRVLEIGTGSGYQMAVLLELTPHVWSIERIAPMAEAARAALAAAGHKQVRIRVGDGSGGWPEQAPFDAIVVTSAAPAVPLPLTAQLAEGGRLVIPVGSRHTQMLKKITRRADFFFEEDLTRCVFVPLIGTCGWQH